MRDRRPKILFKYYLEYALVRFVRFVLLCMPISVASFTMGKCWRWLAPFNARHQRVLRHMKWALGDETTDKDRQKIALKMWENLGRTFCEGIVSDRVIADPKRFTVDQPLFDHWSNECREGSLLITHHFGNWELASAPTVLFSDHQNMGIYKHVKNPLVEAYFLKLRSKIFPAGLYSLRRGAAKKTVAHLKAGGDVSMIADLRDNRGVKVPLFNMPASMSSYPATLARKFDKPLFLAQLRRTKGVHFHMDIAKIDVPKTDDVDQDIIDATRAMHRQFEQWVRRHPDQWMWAPLRWHGRDKATQRPPQWSDKTESKQSH